MKAVEIFAGAGGLALGSAQAGFNHDTVVERDQTACETLIRNQELGHQLVTGWKVRQADVTTFDYGTINDEITLVAGGPPCQPFSMGGKHAGYRDKRDMFPEVFRAVRALRPRAVLVENVRGLLRPAFADYLEYILLQLQYPEAERRPREGWPAHRRRLERHATRRAHADGELTYNVVFQPVNAANYGVPQVRHRVIFVAFRSDVDARWSFPTETHSLDALLHDQWVTGEYWERHRVAKRRRPVEPVKQRSRIDRLRGEGIFEVGPKPWLTVRDAIADLPDPTTKRANRTANHVFQPGAKAYPGHTGSPLDSPAKALKAGVHGVPGGENMIAFDDGSVRYFTVRESARIQTFPDDYTFTGPWSETMRQLGNAVPVNLSQVVASSIARTLRARPSRTNQATRNRARAKEA